MKLLLPVFLLMAVTLSAQTKNNSILLSEGFESDTIPDSWTLVDADGDGNQWELHPSNWSDAHSGAYSIASYSWFNGNVYTPDNWLISPAIPMESNVVLKYYVKAISEGYSQEHYQVRVSTTGTQTADFTDIIIDETLPENNNEWLYKEADLSVYSEETIHIAFVHNQSTNMFALKIDDVSAEKDTTGVGITNEINHISKVYPNPATNGLVSIKSEKNINQVELYSIFGRKVYDQITSDKKVSFNTSNFENGQYILRVKTTDGIETHKISIR